MSAKSKNRDRETSIFDFKTNCFSLVREVSKTKKPLILTRRGTPIAQVVPMTPQIDRRKWLGSMAGTVKILGDIVSPVIDPDDFEVLRD
ncbi:MAG: type II toxin-antitoxin system Phd/YefM family antitoxin [Candidatus Acidiferrales bacterium]